jgi:translation initiation factor 2-alpha kinase 4
MCGLAAKPDSPHHQAVLSSLFSQPPRPSRGFIYDLEADMPEHAALNDNVQERLASIFRLHGAVDMEPPLLMPVMEPDDESHQATFIDRHGDIVTLPNNILVPFARLAARGNLKRIKRYHITNIYRPKYVLDLFRMSYCVLIKLLSSPVAGHPKVQKAAVFDIITPDLLSGPIAAGAELIALANDCLNSFPNLASNYDIHISHSNSTWICIRYPVESH